MQKKNRNVKTVVARFIQEKKIPNDLKTCLALFWAQFQTNNQKVKDVRSCNVEQFDRSYKMNVLKAMAGVVLKRPTYSVRKRRREGFNERRDNPNKLTTLKERQMFTLNEHCFVCSKEPHHRHHIIQLQHGGRNVPTNIVHLCRSCHREVHK